MDLSSDTNVWIDFYIIGGLELPFRLDHIFYMSSDAIGDEVLSPADLSVKLVGLGLVGLEVSEDEYYLAYSFVVKYPKLSRYDGIALAISKLRGFILLSGDRALRCAAECEGVEVRGTLWVYDELVRFDRITLEERLFYLSLLEDNNGGCRGVRLPASEIRKRLDILS